MDDLPDKSPLEILEDLGFDISPRTVGRPRVQFVADYERDLTAADMAALAAAPRASAVVPALKRIHSSHHALARCLASGMKPAQASLVTGYSLPRISTLQNDSAFQGLVAEYRDEAKATFADLAERMAGLSLDAIELLHERLHDSPENFSIPMLLDVVKGMADRTGFGPDQKATVNLTLGTVDRPPRETFEDWERRRQGELAPSGAQGRAGQAQLGHGPPILDLKKLN